MESKYKRIYITGASGTGKTTIAKWVSEMFDLPFVSTSAKKLWPKYGFDNHRQVIIDSIVNPIMGQNYQDDILMDRIRQVQDLNKFVTDRSPFDNYAHILLQGGFMYKPDILKSFSSTCTTGLEFGDLVIFIRYSDDIELEDDDKRIQTTDYQKLIDSTIAMVIERELVIQPDELKVIELRCWHEGYRQAHLKHYLELKKSWLEKLLG